MPGGRFELPTNPESFRGCSTAEDGKSRGLDFSFALMNARFRELSLRVGTSFFATISSVSPSRFVIAAWPRKCCLNRASRSTAEPM